MSFCSYLFHHESLFLVGNHRHIYYVSMEVFVIEDVCNFQSGGSGGGFEVEVVWVVGMIIGAFPFDEFLSF